VVKWTIITIHFYQLLLSTSACYSHEACVRPLLVSLHSFQSNAIIVSLVAYHIPYEIIYVPINKQKFIHILIVVVTGDTLMQLNV